SSAVFGRKADVAVESLIPGLEAPLPQRLVSQPESVASNRTDSLTGEDSLLDCSLLSNPAADLVDEFAPVAFAAQPHKGKTVPLPGCSWMWGVSLGLILQRTGCFHKWFLPSSHLKPVTRFVSFR
uniref:Uncharacterized protein n=1 Tax=Melopsittacus undulatus TaxID=13146 RepID=A0A8C6IVT0_MELUD